MTETTEALKKRILVVDDRVSDTQLVKLSLERTNEYIVKEENDATAAIGTAEAFLPHLILMDVMMPGIDGGELAAVFQAHPTLQSIPIVFFTAAVTHKEVDAGRGLVGGRPFIAKPIVLTELIACLDQQLKPKPVTVQ
jgi:two-component system, OmpR family, response regulator